jgi:hypothetical protein
MAIDYNAIEDVALARAAILTPGLEHANGLTVCISGGVGQGKTNIIRDMLIEEGYHVEVVIASQMEPMDFLGTLWPVTGPDGKTRTSYLPPPWAERAAAHKHSVVIFDEASDIDRPVQKAMQRVICERRVGDLAIKHVPMILLENPVSVSKGYEKTMAMANRIGHMQDWTGASVAQWRAYMRTAGNGYVVQAIRDPEKTWKDIHERWDECYAKAWGLVDTYTARNEAAVDKAPDPDHPDASGPFATRRSWDMAVRAYASSMLHGLSAGATLRFVGQFIGHAAAREFFTFVRAQDLPDCAKVLDGEIQFAHDANRPDRSMVVFATCSTLVAPEKAEKREKRAAALWKLLRENIKYADIILSAAITLCDRKVRLARGVDADFVLAKLAPVLRAAGVQVGKETE